MYGSEVEELGLQVNGTYTINEQFRAAADVGFFFVDDTNGIDTSFWTINANGHYLIQEIPKVTLYGLAGLNVTTVSNEFDTPFGRVDETDSELGLNAGVGGEFPLKAVNLFSEIKYIIGDADQLVWTAGVRIGLGN